MKKNLRTILIVCLLVTVFIKLLGFMFSGFEIGELTDYKSLGITFSYAATITLCNIFYFHYLHKKFDWNKHGKQLLIFGISGSVVVSMIAFFLCRLVQLVYIEQKIPLSEFLEKENPGPYFFTFLIALVISLFFHVFYFYKNLQESKVQEQKIIAGTASAQFDALKNQLDPHFLFNSLNVLASLIDENPDQAQKFTTSLSKVYRYVLEQKNKDLVSVQEELDFARVYIGLLKMRFESGIQFKFPDKIHNPEAKIVPLSLQLLLENAVKHNQISEEFPLTISIYEEEGMLMVKNNSQHKNIIKNSSGIGLRNIRQRYDLLTSRKVHIYEDVEIFKVSLPMLTKQVSYAVEEKKEIMRQTMDYQKRKRAKEKVKKIKGFYGNVTSYCIIIPFLVFVNYFTTGFEFPWFLFPMTGWGIGILFHYMDTYGYNVFLGKNWEERKIRDLMDKD